MPDPLRQTISATEARALFAYDPATGILRWNVARGKMKPGDQAGNRCDDCIQVMIDGLNYKAHRIIWLMMTGQWPNPEVDHRDGDTFNNRWNNLREATRSQQKMNRRKPGPSSSGIKGVFLDKRDGRWYARITVNYWRIHLGRFKSKEEAARAYAAAAEQHYGEFACLTR